MFTTMIHKTLRCVSLVFYILCCFFLRLREEREERTYSIYEYSIYICSLALTSIVSFHLAFSSFRYDGIGIREIMCSGIDMSLGKVTATEGKCADHFVTRSPNLPAERSIVHNEAWNAACCKNLFI
jgi:hypothetical protein